MLFPARWTKPLTDDFESDADKLIQIIELVFRDLDNPNGLRLDEWQKWLLRHVFERYPADWHDQSLAGQLRYRTCVISLPRQQGKSTLTAASGLFALLLRDGQILSVASNTEQAGIIYNKILKTILDSDELEKRFTKATERRGIVRRDGNARYDVKPAKEASIQGYTISNMGLLDELHIWRKGMWSAVQNGISAAKNAILLGITTAGDSTSETLLDLYKQGDRAVNGDPALERFGFFVWEAPEGCALDAEAVLASNPAVECGRIPLAQVLADMALMPEHEARRYRLNQFISGVSESWLPGEVFRRNAGHGIDDINGITLAVDMTSKLDHATIVAAKKNGDKIQTELVASVINPTESKLYDLLSTLSKKFGASAIVIDGSRMPALQKRLKSNGFALWQLWGKEVSAACATTFALFQQDKVEWNSNDQLLIAQMPRGVARYTGENWFLSRRDSMGDIDAVIATTLAIYVASLERPAAMGVF